MATCAHTHRCTPHTHALFSRRVQHSLIGALAGKCGCERERSTSKTKAKKPVIHSKPRLSVCVRACVFGRPAQHLVVVCGVVETGELSALFLTCPHGLAWVRLFLAFVSMAGVSASGNRSWNLEVGGDALLVCPMRLPPPLIPRTHNHNRYLNFPVHVTPVGFQLIISTVCVYRLK